ncbi:hypothetical protein DL769_010414 [Monosporascus sp. CRB-8-3]|nr:hypothetical protein DL769_010414 [Monosporascus sp. CRB-8-3]
MQMSEGNGLLVVECGGDRPGLHRDASHNHSGSIDGDRSRDTRNDEKLAIDPKSTNDRREGIVIQSRGQRQLRAAQGPQLLAGIALCRIDVLVCAELPCSRFLVRAARDDHDAVTHLSCELDSEMAEAAHALDGYCLAGRDVGMLQAGEDGGAGAEQRRELGSIAISGHADSGLGPNKAVLGDYT